MAQAPKRFASKATQARREHAHRERNQKRLSRSQRGYDRNWQKIRGRYLSLFPDCVRCGKKATEVDHIIPLSKGGTHSHNNLQSMCKRCHSKKTAREDSGFANRAKGRGH